MQLFHEKDVQLVISHPVDNGAYFPVILLEKNTSLGGRGLWNQIPFSIFFVLSYHYTHHFLLASQSKLTLDFDKNNIVIAFWFWKLKKKETWPVGKDHAHSIAWKKKLSIQLTKKPPKPDSIDPIAPHRNLGWRLPQLP